MLYTQTITGATLGLLKRLMARPELTQFALVGGTNLSLRFGHRRSIDLDLFTSEPFDHFSIDEMLGFYRAKYKAHDIFHLLRSLVYFADAEAQKDPDPLDKTSWKQVRKKVETAVQHYIDNNLR